MNRQKEEEWGRFLWTQARDLSHLFTLNDFQKRGKKIKPKVKKRKLESRFLHVWFPTDDLPNTVHWETEACWKLRENNMLENITPQESHRINSDLLKCLRSCCLAFEKSCVFMQYKLMVQPLSKCYKFSQEFRICFLCSFSLDFGNTAG